MDEMILLQNGSVIDGSGSPAVLANVLIKNGKIDCVTSSKIAPDGKRVIDCSGYAICPGFIDVHSHNDQLVQLPDELLYTKPFLQQGITTFVGGNCGFSPAGMQHTREPNLLLPNKLGIGPWLTYEAYFRDLRAIGLRQNMAMLAGHGTAASSVIGYQPTAPSTQAQRDAITALLAEGLDAGCKGISFGLGYKPGQFLPDEEIRSVAQLAIDWNKIIAVHSRALNVSLPALYGADMREPHNVRWHREFISRFENSGAKLQISHLIFAGTKAWKTYDAMFSVFDHFARDGGMDLWFDMYAYTQGATTISLMLGHAPYFYQNIDDIYDAPEKVRVLEEELRKRLADRGFPVELMMLCNAQCEQFRAYQGWFIPDILQHTRLTLAEFCMQLYRASNGNATVYFLFEQEEARIPQQMAHPRALYMTDAWYQPGSHQNACAYGSMPKFLRLARESGAMTLEQAVSHMTGLAAQRFDLTGRGFVREGYWADLVILDPKTIAEGATLEQPDRQPIGIRDVFVNGTHVIVDGILDASRKAGRLLTE